MMKVQSLSLSGACLLNPERHSDARGYFCEVYNRRTFEQHGLFFDFVQDNTSLSPGVNTIRGLHFQRPPSAQAKLIWVSQGSVQDVIVDIRRSSPTYGKYLSIELSASNGLQLLVPRGFAHGFLTTSPNTQAHYKTDAGYAPEHDVGLLWNDPDLGIEWKRDGDKVLISEKDRKLPRLRDLPPYFP
jgi:dTDP-4-dehydrorhamnose 3,5-epimerase